MKRLPTRAADVGNAVDAASDAPIAPQDFPWQPAVLPLDHSGSPSAATGEEGIPAYQSPANDLDAGAPADGDGLTATAASVISETSEPASAFLASLADPAAESPGASLTDARIGSDDTTTAPVQEELVDYQSPNTDLDAAAPGGSGGMVTAAVSFAPGTFISGPAILASFANPAASSLGASIPEASIGSDGAIAAPVLEGIVGHHIPHAGLDAAAPADGGSEVAVAASFAPATSTPAPTDLATLANPPEGSVEASNTNSSIGPDGATAAQVQQALDESGLSVNGSGIRVGVLSDSFNDLGGAAADEADGALPPAADIDVIKDLASGGTDEGRAMMQIIHDIAPGADLAFYTAFDSEQDFANGILALAAAGCKVIVDDVSYFDEPFFQNGVVAQAIQTVEAEGVTYVTAAGNDAENAYQAAWTPISGTYDGKTLSDAESFGGSLVQTVTINTEGTGYDVPLLLEWNQAYGQATSDLEILVFNSSGRLVGTATNASNGEPTNPWVEFDFTKSGTYYVAIENLSGPNPGLIKEITEGDGLPATISGANVGSVYGHAMTPGAITAGAVSTADTPAFGVNPAVSESFSSSGAGTELLFANNGTPLSSPDALSPVAVSGVDDINTTVSDLTDFYGTSAAAASLAGVAALILSANPNLTPAEVEQIMEETALPMANSAVSGAGLVAVDAAVAAAEAAAAPAVAVTNVTLSAADASVPASSLFTASTQNEEPITAYGFMDTGPGYFVLEGTDEPNNQEIDVTAAQLSQLAYQSAPGTIDTLQIRAEDATGWSAWISFTVTAPPLVIQTDTGSVGSTSLTEVGSNYFLDNSSGSGPELKYGGADVVAGQFGAWTPIGAVQTASGYDVAWEIPGANEYIVWSTDSNGNYISNLTPVVSGTSTTLESYESIFGQDLNGDGVIGLYAAPGTTLQIIAPPADPLGSATIGAGATLELAVADSGSVTFNSSTGTLILESPSTFSGEIFNFTGNGSLSGSDQIDLEGINYTSVHDDYANGVLTVTDGTDTVKLDFNASYTSANFDFASDGSGGTIVYDPPAPTSNALAPTSSSQTITTSEPPTGGSATIGTGATLKLGAACSEAVTFNSSAGTLILDSSLTSGGQSSNFTGTVSGFGAQDVIDLPGIAFDAQTTLGYLADSNQTGGTLSLTDGAQSAKIALLGNYMASSFAVVSDHHSDSMVTEASQASNQSLLTNPQHT